MEKNNSAVAILRVSSAKQKDNTSHEAQEAEILKYSADVGLKIVHTARITESAKDSENRKQYQAAIKWAFANDAFNICFYMYDRESRNLTDNETSEKLIRAGLIAIHYARERKVFDASSNDSDFFMRDITAVTNKQFIRTLSAKVKDAMAHKGEEGWAPMNRLPLGYCHVHAKDGAGRTIKRGTTVGIDPIGAKQVLREFELRASDVSYRDIRKKIISEGFIPAHKITAYRCGTIERRIKNQFYRGLFTYGGIVYRGKHERIIPDDLIASVDATLGKRPINKIGQGVFGGGWLKCHECGCSIVLDRKIKAIKATGQKKEFRYYRCSNAKNFHKKRTHVLEEKIWGQFLAVFDSFSISEGLATSLAKELNGGLLTQRAAHKKLGVDFKLIIQKLDDDFERVYQDYRDGILDKEFLDRQIKKIRAAKIAAQQNYEKSQNDAFETVIESAKTTIELAKSARSLWLSRTPMERREWLELVLSNRSLEGATIRFDLTKPFMVLEQIKQSGDWRPHRDNFLTAFYLEAA